MTRTPACHYLALAKQAALARTVPPRSKDSESRVFTPGNSPQPCGPFDNPEGIPVVVSGSDSLRAKGTPGF